MSKHTERLVIDRECFKYVNGKPVEHVCTNRELAQRVGGKVPERMSDLVGRKMKFELSAPCTGYVVWVVTRVDRAGVWGTLVEDNSRELTVADVI